MSSSSGSDSGGGGNRQAAAKAAMTSQAAYTSSASPATSPKVSYSGGGGGNNNDRYTQQSLQRYEASREDYDEPDKDAFIQTQKEISDLNRELAKSGQIDIKMSKEEYDQFNKDLNEYYGTENVKYEPYGRAGEGTVNLTFKEHFDNLGMQYPALKLSPTLRFLAAAGKNVGEYLTSDYGTYRYSGSGTDSGGLLGRLGIGGSDNFNTGNTERDVMNRVAPDAPYIVRPDLTKPDSVAQDYFNNINMSQSSPLSSDLQTDYNNAKNNINSLLGITPPSQQFGYSADPYGGLMASNLTTNPYNIDYLRRLGLI
jgi:hypothetical protein